MPAEKQKPLPANRRWRPEEDAVLRERHAEPLRAVARTLGRALRAVRNRRGHLGIQKKRRPRFDRVRLRDLLMAGSFDEAARDFPRQLVRATARAIGIAVPDARWLVWQPDWDIQLGTVPDGVLAARLCVSISLIRQRRQALGVRMLSAKHVRSPAARGATDFALVSMPARQAAAALGCSINDIRYERHRRKLSALAVRGPGARSTDLLRDAMIAGGLAAGAMLADIGRCLGVPITRERCRQLAQRIRAAVDALPEDAGTSGAAQQNDSQLREETPT